MQKITTFLWFDNQAEEATNFYVSVFKNAKVLNVSRGPNDTVFTTSFTLEGQEFIALNGGPLYQFTPAISLFVSCESQAEVDELWNALSADPSAEQCGWLKDKFGLSWQIVPTRLGELLGNPDPEKSQKAMQAMLKMGKLDIAALEAAVAD